MMISKGIKDDVFPRLIDKSTFVNLFPAENLLA